MNVVVMPRRTGKTFLLLQLMKEDPALVMVCASAGRATMLADQFPNIDRNRFLSYDTAKQQLMGRRVRAVCDDVGEWLQWYLGCEVDTITVDKG